jgi:hypothetical protein
MRRPVQSWELLREVTTSIQADGTLNSLIYKAHLKLVHTGIKYSAMASFSSLDDMRSLQIKIDQKAHNLFKEKAGQAPLTVTRIFNDHDEESKEKSVGYYESDREVFGIDDVERLRNVRTSPLFITALALDSTVTPSNNRNTVQ